MKFKACVLVLFTAFAWFHSAAQAQSDASKAAAVKQLDQGSAAFRVGDMTAAARAWSEAVRLARQSRASDIEAQALARRGEMYRTQGHLRNAHDDLTAALANAEAIGDTALIARVSGALGNLEMMPHRHDSAEPALQRRLDLAEALLQRSREFAGRAGDRVTLAASYNDLGNVYGQTARPVEAASAYAEAIRSAILAGDQALAATAEVNAARLAFHQGDLANGQLVLTRAITRLEALPPSYSGGMTLVSAGSLALEQRAASSSEVTQLATRAFRAAAKTADSLQNPVLSSLARGNLARLPVGEASERGRLTEQALFAAQRARTPELSFRWEWQQARQALQQGRGEEALAAYRRAVAGLQSVRQDIPVEYHDGRSSYRITFGPLYLEFADLLLRRAASVRGQAQPLIREARDTVEMLKESELQDYFRDSCISSFKERRHSLVSNVPPGVAVLYLISLPDRLELLVGFGSEQRQFSIPAGEAVLRRQVQNFRELLEKRTTNEYLNPARQLYDQIIRPIEPLLKEQALRTLVVVPDNVLRVIPFAALHDGKHFLVEHYATAIAPSMNLIDTKPPDTGQQVALILGLSKSVQGFAGLPNVLREVTAVQQLKGGKQFLDEAFTESRFATELKNVPYNIVHMASHGRFSSDPKQSFVLAYDGKLSMDELETDIKYGARRQSALELLVLSACETATGDDRAALGLAGIALKAGARSALASLWYINDEAAGELVVDFYRMLQVGGLSKALALQAAQRKMAATQRYGHPAYWAPFLLIGNWL